MYTISIELQKILKCFLKRLKKTIKSTQISQSYELTISHKKSPFYNFSPDFLLTHEEDL